MKNLENLSLESFLGNENPCNFAAEPDKRISNGVSNSSFVFHKTDLLLKDHQ